MKFVLSFICFFLVFLSNAQYKARRHKISSDAGTIFTSWGFNRTAYARSKAHFEGLGYDFNLTTMNGKDIPNIGSGNVLNPAKWTLNQYNFKFGYYYRDAFAITFSVDHLKYQIRDKGYIKLTGQTTFTTDEYIYFNADQSYYHGTWNLVPINPDPSYFDYSYTGGLNFIHIDLTRTEELIKYGRTRQFILNGYYGVGFGLIQSSLNFVYNGVPNLKVNSLSGYGITGLGGLRLEFLRRFYFYSNASLGVLHQVRAKSKFSDSNAFVRQLLGYAQIDAGIGLLFFKKSKNGCDSCPHW